MKYIRYILSVLFLISSCKFDEIDISNDSCDDLVRLNLSSAEDATRAVWSDENGSGSLIFNWETVGMESEDTEDLSLVISDGIMTIPTWASRLSISEQKSIHHTGMSVTPHEDDAHHADFQTVRFYKQDDLNDAKYCFAVAGRSDITYDSQTVCYHLEMPSTFTQTKDQDPSFLRKYMFMYSSEQYKGESTSLKFRHIPATLRFIITNTSNSAVSLQSVSFYISDSSSAEGNQIGSGCADVEFDCTTGLSTLSYEETGYDKITTNIVDASLEPGAKYTSYSMVMPLSSNDIFKNKHINFSVKTANIEHLAYQLNAPKLATANGGEIYNWVGGKSYTIRINIGDDAKISGEIISDNTIEVTSSASGTFVLKYEGPDGQPLDDYAEICTLTVDQTAHYEDFINVNIAPRYAENIGIYDTYGNRLGSISLSTLKPIHAQPLYKFGLLSDLHCQNNDGAQSLDDLQRALTFFNAQNVSMTCICGDITQEGTAEELELYQKTIQSYSSTVPVYTTSGNHDCTSWGQINEAQWQQYTGQSLVFERSVSLPDNSVDHFLFLGMSYWEYLITPYLDPHLSWLEAKLEEYRNERCYIITHLFFPDRAGNMNNIYPVSNWLKDAQLERLTAMCEHYVNTIWFSGHSHWKWDMQKHQDRANVFRTYDNGGSPSSGWCVHIPSCANPSYSDGISTRETRPYESEGAIVEVYEDHIDILGLDLKNKKYLPIASYRLDTSLHEVDPNENNTVTYLSAKDFAYYKGGVENSSVKDVEGMPGYVEVTFTGVSQGYYVTNDTFVQGSSSKVSITFEDLQVISGGKEISSPEKVGFYGGEYYLTDTNSVYVNATSGVQFQTSSSCKGPWPMAIRMKVIMKFY